MIRSLARRLAALERRRIGNGELTREDWRRMWRGVEDLHAAISRGDVEFVRRATVLDPNVDADPLLREEWAATARSLVEMAELAAQGRPWTPVPAYQRSRA